MKQGPEATVLHPPPPQTREGPSATGHPAPAAKGGKTPLAAHGAEDKSVYQSEKFLTETFRGPEDSAGPPNPTQALLERGSFCFRLS